MSEEIKKRIDALKQAIRRHDYLYYVLAQPEISDKEYDLLMKQLCVLEEQYPQYKSPDSPTVRVGGAIAQGFQTIRHRQKMLSLDNTYVFEELRDWEARLHKGLKSSESVEYVVELKIDGVSANITYRNGKFSRGATRGDGQVGEDVTANLKTIRAIPLVLLGKNIPEFIEVRGEVYMEMQDLYKLNQERQNFGELLFANPRNSAAGSLKLLDPGIVAQRRLSFFAHSLGEYQGAKITNQWEFLGKLNDWGLRTNAHSQFCKNLSDVITYCKKWQQERKKLAYQIDGVVIKVNNIEQQKKLGFTLKSPRWAVAYKFPAQQATTEVLDIKVNVGRTGVITPAAQLKPVECAGVVIRNATLHNFDEIKRLGIKKGDRVLIERAGEVIPKIVKVVKSSQGAPFSLPRLCPSCHEKIVQEKDEVAYRCINPSCPAQIKRSLLHFASKAAMDIEGMGEAAVEQLVDKGLVQDFAQIYSLKKFDLMQLELFKEKKSDNLIDAISLSKDKPLSRLIFALGIRHVGEKAAFTLAQKFMSMENLLKARKEDFEDIYEIGTVITDSIMQFFAHESNRKLLSKLKETGLNMKEAGSWAVNSKLSGKKIIFTGELKDFTRSRAEELVRKSGGNTVSAITKNVDLLVAGANPGSKYQKASGLGIKIINEKEFLRLIA
jgi:DNA ligase (NAD+)